MNGTGDNEMNTSMAKEALALASATTVQDFEDMLLALISRGYDVASLLKWGAYYVPRTITNGRSHGGEGKAYFDVLNKHELLTGEAVISCLIHLSHRCKYHFFKELYESFFPVDGDKNSLAIVMAYFNETHTPDEIENRIALMSGLGLLNPADQHSAATEAMLSSILRQSEFLRDMSLMTMFVIWGYPADGGGSCGLRLVPFVSGSVQDAEFFLSRGATVEALGYLTIFHALSKKYLPLARHLFALAVTAEDPATVKAMVALYGDQHGIEIDVDLLDAPVSEGGEGDDVQQVELVVVTLN